MQNKCTCTLKGFLCSFFSFHCRLSSLFPFTFSLLFFTACALSFPLLQVLFLFLYSFPLLFSSTLFLYSFPLLLFLFTFSLIFFMAGSLFSSLLFSFYFFTVVFLPLFLSPLERFFYKCQENLKCVYSCTPVKSCDISLFGKSCDISLFGKSCDISLFGKSCDISLLCRAVTFHSCAELRHFTLW